MSMLFGAVVRASVVVVAALGVRAMLRSRSAALRHWVLAIGIACGAAMPLLQLALPSWNVSPLVDAGLGPGEPEEAVATVVTVQGAPVPRPATLPPAETTAGRGNPVPLAQWLLWAWLAGALAGLSMLIAALSRVSRMAASARPVPAGPLAAMAADIRAAIGLRRPVALLQSANAAAPMTWGAARPRIVLPEGAEKWSDDRARVVLRHELAHVARGDWPAQMLAETMLALYWFNPVFWVAARRLRSESERACDDAVLDSGVGAADYASHLLELARTGVRPGRAVIAMARSSNLEGRVSAMLNNRISRRPLGHATRAALVIAFAAVTVPLAVAQARFSSFSGTVLDQTNRPLPGAVLVLTNASNQAKYEVTTNSAGHFEFVALPPGDYQLAVQLQGFKTIKETMTVAGRDLTLTYQLQIGGIREDVVVTARPPDVAVTEADRDRLEKLRLRVQRVRQFVSEKCAGVEPANQPGAQTPAMVGGTIIPPVKVTDVRPDYSEALKAAGIAGPVVLDAVVRTDGTVGDVTVVSSPHPELERAAIDAVRQWEFTTTYLNCAPVELGLRVMVNFVGK